MIRIVIVDDIPEVRDTIKNLIELDPELKVVGCASNGIEVLKVCDELAPDLVLMDLAMPVCNGAIGTRLLKNTFPAIKVLIMTGIGNNQNLLNALLSGADGYLTKDVDLITMINAVKNTISGVATIDREVLIP